MILYSIFRGPSLNRKDLRALTLVGPTRDNPVLDPLAVLLVGFNFGQIQLLRFVVSWFNQVNNPRYLNIWNLFNILMILNKCIFNRC